jgi:IS30 family transposase
MKKYKELTLSERQEIAILYRKGYSFRQIALELRRSPNTISYEIKNNSTGGYYDSQKAQGKHVLSKRMAKYQKSKINSNNKLREYIIKKLKKGYNPDEISGRMKKKNKPFYVSKTSIYEWLYSAWGQSYCQYLYSKRYRVKKRKKKTKRVMIPDRTSIWERPSVIDNLTRYGHWEVDAIVSPRGKNGYLAVAYERKGKLVKIFKCSSMSSFEHHLKHQKIVNNFKTLSMTFDNGIENKEHSKLGIPTYFCDPYSSWQKGGVENVNKMIRRYISKGTDISKLSKSFIQKVEDLINNKARKSLNYKTALEVAVRNGIIKNRVS